MNKSDNTQLSWTLPDIFDAIMEGSKQIDAGEGIDGETVKKQLEKKYESI